jgi:hypothetical protein
MFDVCLGRLQLLSQLSCEWARSVSPRGASMLGVHLVEKEAQLDQGLFKQCKVVPLI